MDRSLAAHDAVATENKISKVMREGGSFDQDGDGSPELVVDVDAERHTIRRHEGGVLRPETVYENNRLVLKKVDENLDGKVDGVVRVFRNDG